MDSEDSHRPFNAKLLQNLGTCGLGLNNLTEVGAGSGMATDFIRFKNSNNMQQLYIYRNKLYK